MGRKGPTPSRNWRSANSGMENTGMLPGPEIARREDMPLHCVYEFFAVQVERIEIELCIERKNLKPDRPLTLMIPEAKRPPLDEESRPQQNIHCTGQRRDT